MEMHSRSVIKSCPLFALAALILSIRPIAVSAQAPEFTYMEPEEIVLHFETIRDRASAAPTGENLYYLAQYYIASGKPDSARIHLDRALEEDSKSAVTHVGLGELELLEGRAAEADRLFARAVKLSRSKDADVLYRIGMARLRSGKDAAGAVDALQNAIELDGSNSEYFVGIGDAYLAAGDLGKAASSYDQALYFTPGMPKALVRHGNLSVSSQSYSAALKSFQTATEADPSYVQGFRSLGELYFMAKQYEKAADAYGRYIEGSSPTDEERFTYAGYLFLNDRFAESLEQLEKIGPALSNPVMDRLLAYNYMETGRYDDGLRRMESFIGNMEEDKLLASDFEYHGRLLLAARNDTSAAVGAFHAAIDRDSSKAGLHREVAALLFLRKKYVESASEYERMEAKGSALTATDLLNLGKSHYFARDYLRAEPAFGRVTEMASSSPSGWIWRARAAARLDPESLEGLARPYYEKYIELATDREKFERELVEAYFYLAYHHAVKQELDRALQYVNEVLSLNPDHEQALILSQALTSTGGSR